MAVGPFLLINDDDDDDDDDDDHEHDYDHEFISIIPYNIRSNVNE